MRMHKLYIVTILALIICFTGVSQAAPTVLAEHFVSITDTEYGADPNATWNATTKVCEGTDNAAAINACAAYCRANGYTMLIPKGNCGVSSTIWLNDPDNDGKLQQPLTVIGSYKGAYLGTWTPNSSNICVLDDFTAGTMITVTKIDSSQVSEPNLIPVLAIDNGRQVHVEGVAVYGNNRDDLICAVGIGNVSQVTSFRNCSFNEIYAGIVFPAFRSSSLGNSVYDSNNDLLLVEQCTFSNAYNIVCGGTQPFACEYRNSYFGCDKSVFTANLITNYYGHSRVSPKFSSSLLGSVNECCKEGEYRN